MQGRVKFHRKITERERYSDANTFRVFFHLITIANHKDWKRQWIEVKRWQTITGRIELAKQLNLSEMQIRTSLDKLERTGEISKKVTNRYSIITVVKYCDYNDYDLEDNQQITNKQPTDNQQLTTNKNDKNDKNEKEIISSDFFDLFRMQYPRKINKEKSKQLFDKCIKSWVDPNIIIAGAKQYALSRVGVEREFIKHPTTRLNWKNWEDELEINISKIYLQYIADGRDREVKRAEYCAKYTEAIMLQAQREYSQKQQSWFTI